MTVQLDHESPAGNDEPEPASSAEEPPERASEAGGLVVDLTLSREASAAIDGSAEAWLVENARRASEHLNLEGELRVRVVCDTEMAKAHEKHLGEPDTTDVMTFDLADGAAVRGAPVDADLLVCVDEAARKASEHGYSVERELLLYVVHGLLHCLGHDDYDENSYQRMHALEDELLEAIGVGATFSPDPNSRGASA
ncbi:MAG: rRNA maturation RNase YbeY [Phycisphaera sp.]|nr:MAG: rRNA maturation RNase YbeY [Phycisphaera sp.]